MKNQLTQTGLWHVKENGHLVYLDKENEIFTIQSRCLGNPNLFYELSCLPHFNLQDFFPKYLLAARKSGFKELTFKLKHKE